MATVTVDDAMLEVAMAREKLNATSQQFKRRVDEKTEQTKESIGKIQSLMDTTTSPLKPLADLPNLFKQHPLMGIAAALVAGTAVVAALKARQHSTPMASLTSGSTSSSTSLAEGSQATLIDTLRQEAFEIGKTIIQKYSRTMQRELQSSS
jgi:hypothetical protein